MNTQFRRLLQIGLGDGLHCLDQRRVRGDSDGDRLTVMLMVIVMAVVRVIIMAAVIMTVIVMVSAVHRGGHSGQIQGVPMRRCR